MRDCAPAFPTAGGALVPLKAAAEKQGCGNFSSLWSAQAAALAVPAPATEVIQPLTHEVAERLSLLGSHGQ